MTDRPADREISMTPVELAEIAATLESGSARFTAKAARILAALDPETTAESPYRAYAADPRNEPAQPVADRHDAAVTAARELLGSLGSGMSALGGAIAVFGKESAGLDATAAAEVRRASDSAS